MLKEIFFNPADLKLRLADIDNLIIIQFYFIFHTLCMAKVNNVTAKVHHVLHYNCFVLLFLYRYCFEDSLDKKLVNGKIVFCDGYTLGTGAMLAGAVGVVMPGGAVGKLADTYPLPLSSLSLEDSAKLYIYLNSTRYMV